MLTYFDLNVFNDLFEKRLGITEHHENAVRAAISAKALSIPLSAHILDETWPDSASHTDRAMEKFRFILSLVDQQRIVKPIEEILPDDIACYARGEAPMSPFVEDPRASEILPELRSWSDPTPHVLAGLLEDARAVRKQKVDFSAEIRQARDQMHAELSGVKQPNPSFESHWRDGAEVVLSGLVERFGLLNACRERGLAAMLEIKSVRMYVGLSLSYGFSQSFEGRGEAGKTIWDIRHAIVAAATSDVFVTRDGELKRLLARVPFAGFKVRSLCELLRDLRLERHFSQ